MANKQPLVMRFRDGSKQHWTKALDSKDLVQGATFYGGKYAKIACEDLLAKAREIIAFKTGVLWRSGLVEKAPNKTDFTAYRVSFDTRRIDGQEFNYAIVAHEDPHAGQYNHPDRDSYRTTGEGGHDHYLSTPYKANQVYYTEFLRKGIREMLGDRKYNKMFTLRK